MLWVIVIHSYNFALRWMYFSNPNSLDQVYKSLSSQLLANGSFACDTFFFVGGFLLPYLACWPSEPKQVNAEAAAAAQASARGRKQQQEKKKLRQQPPQQQQCDKTTDGNRLAPQMGKESAATSVEFVPRFLCAAAAANKLRLQRDRHHNNNQQQQQPRASAERLGRQRAPCTRAGRAHRNTNEPLARAFRQVNENNNNNNLLLLLAPSFSCSLCPSESNNDKNHQPEDEGDGQALAKNRITDSWDCLRAPRAGSDLGLHELELENNHHHQQQQQQALDPEAASQGSDFVDYSEEEEEDEEEALYGQQGGELTLGQAMRRVLAKLAHRYVRMMPLMMSIIGLSATLLRYLGDEGAQWSESTMMFDHWCRKNWWVNALFLHNFFRRENMCLSHSWYSAVDLQLFLVGQLLLVCLLWSRKWGLAALGALVCLSQVLTGALTVRDHLPAVPLLSSVSEQTMNLYYGQIYIKPYCRASPYLIGMLLAYLMRTTRLGSLRLARVSVLGARGDEFFLKLEFFPLTLI